MTVYNREMPLGIPGGVTRRGEQTVESVLMAVDLPFGAPLALDETGKAVLAKSAAELVGFLVRPYPTMGVPSIEGSEEAPKGSLQGLLRRGYMCVRLAGPASGLDVLKRGQPVKLVTAANGDYRVSDLAAAVGEAIPKAAFMGPGGHAPDGTPVCEIAFNI